LAGIWDKQKTRHDIYQRKKSMSEFDEQALAWMRESLMPTLPQRATLYVPQYTPDDGGGTAIAWDVSAEDVPCRLDAIPRTRDNWAITDDVLGNDTTYRAVFLYDTPLRPDMRVQIGDVTYWVMSCSTEHGAKLVVHAVLRT
jgi:hypothetical protein